MKITLVFLFISVIGTYAINSYAQTTKLTMSLNDKTIEEVLSKIEEESEFRFFYNENVDLERKVSIDIKNKTVFNVLDEILEDTNIKYELKGRQIALYNKGESHAWLSDQQVNISGNVTSAEGEPLPGVSVIVKGKASGTVTDLDGNYQLSANGKDVLVFTFIGMLSQEVAVNNRTNINVVMQADMVNIEEVVAIGYGTRKKSDLTGAVSVIDSEQLTKEVKMSPELAMQGKMAGVFISNPGSDPTARPTVRIRGVGTLGFNDPLYVIDGVPITEGGANSSHPGEQDMRTNINVLSMINPNDIASISVLKDASATAIYGVRASNGVILIQTKRGQAGKLKVDISARTGIQNIYKRYDVMNMADYVRAHNEAWDNNPNAARDETYGPLYDSSSPEYLGDSPNYSKDWMNETLNENALTQDYNVSISGGNKLSTYSVGSGYSMQENVINYGDFERYSFFVNSDHSITDWLKVGESYRFVYTNTERGTPADFNYASFIAPWQPMYDTENVNGLNGYAFPSRVIDGSFNSSGYGNSTRSNPAGGQFRRNQYDMLRNLGTFYAEISPLDGLRLRGSVSFDHYTNRNERITFKEEDRFSSQRGFVNPNGNIYNVRDNINTNIIKEFLVGYNNSFGKHNVDVVLNAMDQNISWTIEQKEIGTDSPIPNWEQRRIQEGWPAENKGLFLNRYSSALQGYMARLSYNFDSKYYLDATVRRDGSSKFGPGYKWGTFPSVAGAWRISSESFMDGISWLDDLKLRVGWGQTGNQETRDFAYISVLNMSSKYFTGSDPDKTPGQGVPNPGAVLGDFPIEDMSWETSTTTNIGIDAVLLDNNLSVTVEYYNRLTEGILQAINIPLIVGALSNPVVNLAEVENKGFEFQARYQKQIGDFGYSVSANLTTVKNEVLSLFENKATGGNFGRLEVGRPINFLYGYRTSGIFQSQSEVDEWLANVEDPGNSSQKAAGDVRFVDIFGAPTDEDGEFALRNESPDGKIDAFDQTMIGKTIPSYYYGISLGLNYKNWDFSADFRGVGDVQRINSNGKNSIGPGGANFLEVYNDRWTPSNPSNTIPRAINGDPSGNNRISDRHVEDAGFLRLQNLQVGYNLQAQALRDIGLNNTRIYVSGSNLLVMTPYSGLDPENDTTPVTFILGVNLSF